MRDKIRVYNTYAGYQYNAKQHAGPGGRRLIGADGNAAADTAAGPYEDQIAFMNRPAELVASLQGMGIGAMKIWPFDVLSTRDGGQSITREELRRGVEPCRLIREAHGDRMDLTAELHSI